MIKINSKGDGVDVSFSAQTRCIGFIQRAIIEHLINICGEDEIPEDEAPTVLLHFLKDISFTDEQYDTIDVAIRNGNINPEHFNS